MGQTGSQDYDGPEAGKDKPLLNGVGTDSHMPTLRNEKKGDDRPEFIIIGAGPAGLATACLLHKAGKRVLVLESRPTLSSDPELSYPIGINPRTMHTLKMIDPDLAQQAMSENELIDAWEFTARGRQVAFFPSGTVYGTTRGSLTYLLYKQAQKQGIQIELNTKVIAVDFLERTLTTSSGSMEVKRDASRARVIATDGVWSSMRETLQAEGFLEYKTFPWGQNFRPIFASHGKAEVKGMDKGVHYIHDRSSYLSLTRFPDGRQCWTAVLSVNNQLPREHAFLLSEEPHTENITRLRQYLRQEIPLLAEEFSDVDLSRYFTRSPFKGQIVWTSRLNAGEWLLLLGDAAHGVLPATGEGVNSAMEDASILAELLKEKAADDFDLFTEYNSRRLPDLHGLFSLAAYLNETSTANVFEKSARITYTIMESCLTKRGVYPNTHYDFMFGPKAALRLPYRTITGEWARRKGILLPLCRVVVYPCVLLLLILFLPFFLLQQLWHVTCRSRS